MQFNNLVIVKVIQVIGFFDLDLRLPNILSNIFSDKCVLINKIKNKFGNLYKELFCLKDSIEIKLTGEIEL